ncbi:hypothetical protein ILUMI_04692 [Ignelater luminosus]|uniref:Uncharacterized protein n=1 Tax=Ignelater luminosus TaxID=2038154 RepID=A0A8K0DJ87_IGNLU|nr:hypothetical protein ILUMI_04692 [Ignelater luminosus]
MPEDRLTKRVFVARVHETNKRGRPRRTWQEKVEKAAKEKRIRWEEIKVVDQSPSLHSWKMDLGLSKSTKSHDNVDKRYEAPQLIAEYEEIQEEEVLLISHPNNRDETPKKNPGITKRDRVRYEDIRADLAVKSLHGIIEENQLYWFKHTCPNSSHIE